MDKLLIYTKVDVFSEKSSLGKKLKRQYKAFSSMFDTYMISLNDNNVILTHKNKNKVVAETDSWVKALFAINKCTVECVKKFDIPYVFIRYPMSEPAFNGMLKKVSKHSRIILELPTYPYDDEIKNYGVDLKNKMAYYIDRICRHRMKKYVYKIASYSNYDNIFGIEAFPIVNAVFVDEIKPRTLRNVDGTIHVIAVAEMQQSHGYDRFIKGLNEYYKNGGGKEVYLHLAGNGNEKETYEELVKKYSLEKYVIFHGYCVGDELEDLYNNSDIALERLGLHRIGAALSSSLKSREYLCKGFPMISSSKVDVIPEDYKYQLMFEANENPVDINKVVEFYNSIYVDEQNDVINDIRSLAYEKCDIIKALEPVKERFYE
ncbi:MAG: glycosyltransferase [Lachnospiraceae bacterium]|nr:glycosyltransferase [Lachnospiraceae bacterium]